MCYIIDNKAVGVAKAGNTFTIEPMISEGTWRDEHWVDYQIFANLFSITLFIQA